MQSFSLGVSLANKFSAWWSTWHLALVFDVGRYHPKGEVNLLLTEDRASSAWVLQSNGAYVERATGEPAIGQGVGGQVSDAVTNYVSAPDMSGAVAGVPGSYPSGWSGFDNSGGVQREIVGVGERNGLPTLKLRFSGEWDSGHAGYANIALCATGAMPITKDDQMTQGLHIALIAGSLSPLSYMNLNAYYRLAAAYKGQASLAMLPAITDEFKQVSKVNPILYPTGGVCDGVDLQIYFSVPAETSFDFTLEIGAPFLTPVAFIPPVNIGSGTTTARAGDNPVVVQGEGGLPYPGYNIDGTLSGRELVEGGGFDTQGNVDLWTAQSAVLTLSSGSMRTANIGTNHGGGSLPVSTTPGRVHALSGQRVNSGAGAGSSDCHLGDADSHNKYVNGGVWTDGPFYSLAEMAAVDISATVGGNTDAAWKEHDNISLQEVEPGVTIEAAGVWGDTDEQIAFRLSDGTTLNEIKAMRLNAGNLRLAVIKDGALIYGADASGAWPDNTEATLRLEITDTDDGTFYALFLDDVFTGLGAGPVDYPDAINQLDLAPVAGVKTIKSVKVR